MSVQELASNILSNDLNNINPLIKLAMVPEKE